MTKTRACSGLLLGCRRRNPNKNVKKTNVFVCPLCEKNAIAIPVNSTGLVRHSGIKYKGKTHKYINENTNNRVGFLVFECVCRRTETETEIFDFLFFESPGDLERARRHPSYLKKVYTVSEIFPGQTQWLFGYDKTHHKMTPMKKTCDEQFVFQPKKCWTPATNRDNYKDIQRSIDEYYQSQQTKRSAQPKLSTHPKRTPAIASGMNCMIMTDTEMKYAPIQIDKVAQSKSHIPQPPGVVRGSHGPRRIASPISFGNVVDTQLSFSPINLHQRETKRQRSTSHSASQSRIKKDTQQRTALPEKKALPAVIESVLSHESSSPPEVLEKFHQLQDQYVLESYSNRCHDQRGVSSSEGFPGRHMSDTCDDLSMTETEFSEDEMEVTSQDYTSKCKQHFEHLRLESPRDNFSMKFKGESSANIGFEEVPPLKFERRFAGTSSVEGIGTLRCLHSPSPSPPNTHNSNKIFSFDQHPTEKVSQQMNPIKLHLMDIYEEEHEPATSYLPSFYAEASDTFPFFGAFSSLSDPDSAVMETVEDWTPHFLVNSRDFN